MAKQVAPRATIPMPIPVNIPDAISFGLTFAAVGFLFASLVGVPLANWGVRKGFTVSVAKDLP